MKILKNLAILFVLAAVVVLAGGAAPAALASGQAAPNLGSAASFVALASSTMTNTGAGVFYGNVGVTPGTSVVGFPPGKLSNGEIYRGGAVAAAARNDAITAYNALDNRACTTQLTGQDLGGMTLEPGVYCFNTSAQLTGDLVLDAQGDPLAIWIFQTGSTLTTASDSSVRLINHGRALNVFWQIGSSTTVGTGSHFQGNILAQASITFNTGAGLAGRAISLNGAVTMDTTGSPMLTNTPLMQRYLPIVKRR